MLGVPSYAEGGSPMRIMPLDIHQKQFTRSLRGFDEREVDEFLDQVADELERLFKENIDQAEKIEALEEKLKEYQGMERTLHKALLSAQKSADDMMRLAQDEDDAVLMDAEVKAKDIIHTALTDKQKATADLARIKEAEVDFRSRFRQLLERCTEVVTEVELAKDVTLIVEHVGSELFADATVSTGLEPELTTVAEAEKREFLASESIAQDSDESPAAHEGHSGRTGERVAAAAAPASAYIAGLHLGDRRETALDPDATVEFNVAEFGYGERESDLDIESID